VRILFWPNRSAPRSCGNSVVAKADHLAWRITSGTQSWSGGAGCRLPPTDEKARLRGDRFPTRLRKTNFPPETGLPRDAARMAGGRVG
jgi:hypothetical protein